MDDSADGTGLKRERAQVDRAARDLDLRLGKLRIGRRFGLLAALGSKTLRAATVLGPPMPFATRLFAV